MKGREEQLVEENLDLKSELIEHESAARPSKRSVRSDAVDAIIDSDILWPVEADIGSSHLSSQLLSALADALSEAALRSALEALIPDKPELEHRSCQADAFDSENVSRPVQTDQPEGACSLCGCGLSRSEHIDRSTMCKDTENTGNTPSDMHNATSEAKQAVQTADEMNVQQTTSNRHDCAVQATNAPEIDTEENRNASLTFMRDIGVQAVDSNDAGVSLARLRQARDTAEPSAVPSSLRHEESAQCSSDDFERSTDEPNKSRKSTGTRNRWSRNFGTQTPTKAPKCETQPQNQHFDSFGEQSSDDVAQTATQRTESEAQAASPATTITIQEQLERARHDGFQRGVQHQVQQEQQQAASVASRIRPTSARYYRSNPSAEGAFTEQLAREGERSRAQLEGQLEAERAKRERAEAMLEYSQGLRRKEVALPNHDHTSDILTRLTKLEEVQARQWSAVSEAQQSSANSHSEIHLALRELRNDIAEMKGESRWHVSNQSGPKRSHVPLRWNDSNAAQMPEHEEPPAADDQYANTDAAEQKAYVWDVPVKNSCARNRPASACGTSPASWERPGDPGNPTKEWRPVSPSLQRARQHVQQVHGEDDKKARVAAAKRRPTILNPTSVSEEALRRARKEYFDERMRARELHKQRLKDGTASSQ